VVDKYGYLYTGSNVLKYNGLYNVLRMNTVNITNILVMTVGHEANVRTAASVPSTIFIPFSSFCGLVISIMQIYSADYEMLYCRDRIHVLLLFRSVIIP